MPNYYVGLDLGQLSDYSALAIARQDWPTEETTPRRASYFVGDLHRWPLQTPYTQIVADVRERLTRLGATDDAAGVTLIVDGTGVGRPVVEMFERAQLPAALIDVRIHGGDQVTHFGEHGRKAPKRDLATTVQVLAQAKRLTVPGALAEAATLVAELRSFTVKINPETAHDSYAAWRENDHDDLVLAVALAVWFGEHGDAADPDLGYFAHGSAHVGSWHGSTARRGGALISTNGGAFVPRHRRI